MERSEVWFESGGERCAAWLYRPASEGAASDGRAPCVVLAHGFGGVREARLDAYAERFASAGLAALVFDYRHSGLAGASRASCSTSGASTRTGGGPVAFARSLRGVDPDRVALWGTSFSGGHVIELAAGDERIAAVVAQSPFLVGPSTLRRVPPRTLASLTAAAWRMSCAT